MHCSNLGFDRFRQRRQLPIRDLFRSQNRDGPCVDSCGAACDAPEKRPSYTDAEVGGSGDDHDARAADDVCTWGKSCRSRGNRGALPLSRSCPEQAQRALHSLQARCRVQASIDNRWKVRLSPHSPGPEYLMLVRPRVARNPPGVSRLRASSNQWLQCPNPPCS